MIPVKVKQFEEGLSWIERRTTSSSSIVGMAPLTSSSSSSSSPQSTTVGGGVSATSSTVKSVSLSVVDLIGSPSPAAVDIESLCDALAASKPSLVFVHNVSPSGRQQLMQSPHVRRLYAVSDLVRHETREGTAERGTVALVRIGLHCEAVENITRQLDSTGAVVRLFLMLQLQVRTAGVGAVALTAAVLFVDSTVATARQRVALFTSAVPLLGTPESLLLAANLHTVSAEMHAACTARGFVEALDEATTSNTNNNNNNGGESQEWSVWVKSTKFTTTQLTHETILKGLPPIITATFGPRSASTITIPQPRSAKSGNSRGSPALSSATPAIMTDPAILSAEAVVKGGTSGAAKSTASGIIERLLLQQQQQNQQYQQQQLQLQQHQHQQLQQQGIPRWRITHSYTLKNNEKLSPHEIAFDISAHFSSVQEAVEALNSRTIYWPADFCVVHNIVLVSDNIGQCDIRVMFRRYAKEYKNSGTLLSQMFLPVVTSGATANININSNNHNNNNITNTNNISALATASEKTTWLKRVTAAVGHTGSELNGVEDSAVIPVSRALRREEKLRNRSWDIAWSTIVYQVTPREMKFNITSAVGLGKDNLNEAVRLLNLATQLRHKATIAKENPLQNYPHDYALLFSMELQGYWLIAATHVPCDIVACRAAA